MAATAHHPENTADDTAISAAFMQNHQGAVCIAFSDPAYVRSETIVVDRKDCKIYAILHESSHLIGSVSDAMADAFAGSREALLTALRPDGTIFELQAPVQIGGNT